jgi:hypothetical protein
MHKLVRSIPTLFVALGLVVCLSAAAVLADPTSSGSPAAQPSPAASVDPKVTSLAREWLHRFQTGDIDRSQLTDELNAKLTPDLVTQVKTQLGPLGDPTDVSFVEQRAVQNSTVYQFAVSFSATKIREFISLNAAGKIDGIFFAPAP